MNLLRSRRRYRQHKMNCRSELYAMKQSAHASGAVGGLCDAEPPLISGLSTTGAGDDLAVTSLPLPLRHYESPYRAVTWSPRHVIDDFRADLVDGHYGTRLTHGTAQTLCLRRHREVALHASSALNLV